MEPTTITEVTPNTTWCNIIVKPLVVLGRLAVERDADGLLIENQWYMYEMENLLPSNRTITVLREFDYFVWQDSNKDEWRIQDSWVEQNLGDTFKPSSWVDEPNIPQADGTTQPSVKAPEPEPIVPEVNPFEGCATVFKNPKGTKSNKYPIEVGDFCLINGLSIPKQVLSVTGSKIIVDRNNTEYLAKDVFPLYEIHNAGRPIIGDVVNTLKYGYVYLDSQEAVELLATRNFKEHYRYTSPDDVLINREVLKRFKCGEYTHNNKRLTDAEVQKELNKRFKPIIEEVDISFELDLIAKHYSIDVKDVLPKEVKILKALEVVLDHPEFVKQKEWAMLIGPSGSGKTQVAIEYAESKGLEYNLLSMTAQVSTFDMMGYNSITTGEYFASLLRDAIENGKVMILDEIDAANMNTLICLNALKVLEAQFPDKKVKVHQDFRLIATANTLVRSEDFSARGDFDRATLKRFSLINYTLTPAELAVRFGFNETKNLTDKMTTKLAYNKSDYELVQDCILRPVKDLDVRDIMRHVALDKIIKEGGFK